MRWRSMSRQMQSYRWRILCLQSVSILMSQWNMLIFSIKCWPIHQFYKRGWPRRCSRLNLVIGSLMQCILSSLSIFWVITCVIWLPWQILRLLWPRLGRVRLWVRMMILKLEEGLYKHWLGNSGHDLLGVDGQLFMCTVRWMMNWTVFHVNIFR